MAAPIAAAAAAAAGGSLLDTYSNWGINSWLAQQENEFNMNEARRARDFQREMENTQFFHQNILMDEQRDNQEYLDNLARVWQSEQNAKAMAHSSSEAALQRSWEQEMASTAHQREMQDLRSAGLNPILAVAHSGAAVPNGAVGNAFANGASGGSASGGSVSTPMASTARANAHNVHISSFKSVASLAGELLNNAHKLSMQADRFEHQRQMQERYQKFQRESFNSNRKDKDPVWDADWLEKGYVRLMRDMAKGV